MALQNWEGPMLLSTAGMLADCSIIATEVIDRDNSCMSFKSAVLQHICSL